MPRKRKKPGMIELAAETQLLLFSSNGQGMEHLAERVTQMAGSDQVDYSIQPWIGPDQELILMPAHALSEEWVPALGPSPVPLAGERWQQVLLEEERRRVVTAMEAPLAQLVWVLEARATQLRSQRITDVPKPLLLAGLLGFTQLESPPYLRRQDIDPEVRIPQRSVLFSGKDQATTPIEFAEDPLWPLKRQAFQSFSSGIPGVPLGNGPVEYPDPLSGPEVTFADPYPDKDGFIIADWEDAIQSYRRRQQEDDFQARLRVIDPFPQSLVVREPCLLHPQPKQTWWMRWSAPLRFGRRMWRRWNSRLLRRG